MTKYSTLKVGEKFRIVGQPEIWTKRKIRETNFIQPNILVYKEPDPELIEDKAVLRLLDCIHFYGIDFETWVKDKEVIKVDAVDFISPITLIDYLESRTEKDD